MSKFPPSVQAWIEVEVWLRKEASTYEDAKKTLGDAAPGIGVVAHAISHLLIGLANDAGEKAIEASNLALRGDE